MKVEFFLKIVLSVLIGMHFVLISSEFLKKIKFIKSISNVFLIKESNYIKKTISLSFFFYILFLFFLILYISSPKTYDYSFFLSIKSPYIIFGFDVSKTMKAEDIVPGRIEKAKEIAQYLLKNLRNDLLVEIDIVSSKNYVVSPRTSDREFIKKGIFKIKTRDVKEINGFVKYINSSACKKRDLASLVIFTDGEIFNKSKYSFIDARKCGVKFFVVGIGNIERSTIPIRDSSGKLLGWEKNEMGENIYTTLNISGILKVSNKKDSIFLFSDKVLNREKEFAKIISEKINIQSFRKNISVNKDLSPIFLFLSFLFFTFFLAIYY